MKPLIGLLAAACALVSPSAARAFSPYLVVPDPRVAEASPAYRYANTTDAEALAELDRRGVLYVRVDSAPGVRAPVRLAGRLHGVYVHASIPPEKRATSPFEILDARLALALDDFCALLERHEIDELVHFTMYRPEGRLPPAGDAPPGALARTQGARPRPAIKPPPRKARRSGDAAARRKDAGPAKRNEPRGPLHAPTRHKLALRDAAATSLQTTAWAAPGTRHPAGLAIDVAMFHKKDGRWLSVRADFHGRLGVKTCGEGALVPESPEARELHALVCESQERGTFTYVLTPDYNAAHVDHFHMEVKPGVRWFLYH